MSDAYNPVSTISAFPGAGTANFIFVGSIESRHTRLTFRECHESPIYGF